MDGLELLGPQEGQTGALEELSEDAKQRFAAAAKALQQQRRDEKKAKKRDDQVARTIIKFLNDDKHTRFFILISKLVARNCPSIFILALLSLINEECLAVVQEYFADVQSPTAEQAMDETKPVIRGDDANIETNRRLIGWITRLQLVLAHDAERVLDSLLINPSAELGPGQHLDGSVLQLTIFILQEFFVQQGRELPYEKAQPLTASILQTVFEPFLHRATKKPALEAPEEKDD